MNEPAFPQPEIQYNYGRGMTLRDYFAAKVLQALLTRETKFSENLMMYTGTAYDVADAMLESRSK
mgnify:CR=1 FL=1